MPNISMAEVWAKKSGNGVLVTRKMLPVVPFSRLFSQVPNSSESAECGAKGWTRLDAYIHH